MAHRESSPLVHSVSALTAGVVATSCTHPLDVLKVRFQVQHVGSDASVLRYSSTVQAFRSIVATEGPKGLFKGMAPNLVGNGAAWGFYFLFYSMFRAPEGDRDTANTLISAAGAGVLTACMTNPIWLVKTRMITQVGVDSRNYVGASDAIRTIYKEEGVAGFYRGIGPAIFGVSHGAAQMLAYEQIRGAADAHFGELNGLHYFVIGAMAKIVASVTTYPYSVVKARLQTRELHYTRFSNSLEVIRHILLKEGLQGFYRGLVPSTLRVMPHAAIVFGVYEKVREQFD